MQLAPCLWSDDFVEHLAVLEHRCDVDEHLGRWGPRPGGWGPGRSVATKGRGAREDASAAAGRRLAAAVESMGLRRRRGAQPATAWTTTVRWWRGQALAFAIVEQGVGQTRAGRTSSAAGHPLGSVPARRRAFSLGGRTEP